MKAAKKAKKVNSKKVSKNPAENKAHKGRRIPAELAEDYVSCMKSASRVSMRLEAMIKICEAVQLYCDSVMR